MNDCAIEMTDQKAKDMAEFKAACGSELAPQFSQTNPDGSRLYVVNLPVHPDWSKRKQGYETVILWCRERQGGIPLDPAKPVECEVGFFNGGSCGFGTSYLVKRATDDLTAIWEVGCSLYHRDW